MHRLRSDRGWLGRGSLLALALLGWAPSPALAGQAPAAPAQAAPASAAQTGAPPAAIFTTSCGNQVATPAALPPAGSPAFIWILEPCFDKQGGFSTIESETYMYYIKLQSSLPSQGVFRPLDEAAERTMLADFKALWATNFLEDLSIETAES